MCGGRSSLCGFFFECCGDHRDLHSFPTRRSSDLAATRVAAERCRRGDGPALLVAETFRMGGHARSEGTRLNSSHTVISYAVFCLKKKKKNERVQRIGLEHCDHALTTAAQSKRPPD